MNTRRMETIPARKRKLQEKDRFDLLSDLLVNYSLGNFDYKIEVSENLDEIDTVISGINMLGEELKEVTISRNYLNNIFNTVSDMLFVFDAEGYIKIINRSVTEILGYAEEDLTSLNLFRLLKGDKVPAFNFSKQPPATDNKLYGFEADLLKVNGQTIPALCEVTTLNLSGKSPELLFSAKDLSSLRYYEASLRLSEEKYRRIFEHSSDPILIFSDKGTVIEMNNTAALFLDIPNVPGKHINLLNLFYDKREMREFFFSTKKSSTLVNFSFKLLNYRNKLRDCLISVSPIFNYAGTDGKRLMHSGISCLPEDNCKEMSGKTFVGIIRDITETKQEDNKIIRAIVNTQEKERERFASDLHDSLGQQLSAIRFYLGTLAADETPLTHNKLLERSIDALNNTITELRNICFNLKPRTLEDFGITHALFELKKKIEIDGELNIKILVEDKLPQCEKDLETALFRIAQEFIGNSIKHGKAKNIIIQLFVKNQKLVMKLEDDGIGFSPAQQRKQNRGMGLRNVKTRVTSYNGTITIKSVLKKGTYYRISIPLVKDGE